MKKLIIYILILFCVNVFAQKTYTFDYYTVYEFKQNEEDINPDLEYSFSNSKNNNYQLRFRISDNFVRTIILADFDKMISRVYHPQSDFNDINKLQSLLVNDTVFNLNTNNKECFETLEEFVWDIDYSQNYFTIKKFTNEQKKELISTTYYITKPNDITKNQIYSNSWLGMCFLRFGKYKIESNEVIVYAYQIKEKIEEGEVNKDRKRYIRELKEIQKIDLTINTTN